MINNRKVVVVMPAYNAARTLSKTFEDIPFNFIDDIILVDDFSSDNTRAVAEELGIKHIIRFDSNKGYGANQKACYSKALELNADIVIMIHADYQYDPRLIPAMCSMIAYNIYPIVLGTRILGKGALKGGMPVYKYIANRLLTLFQNIFLNEKLSEYHTGLRAYSADVLRAIPYLNNSDNFVFDNEMLAQIIMKGYSIGEVSCPTRYFEEASSISFRKSVIYGLGVLRVSFQFRLHKWGVLRSRLFEEFKT
jgi:glycosyltransferase involved in cell wall biosynthesis